MLLISHNTYIQFLSYKEKCALGDYSINGGTTVFSRLELDLAYPLSVGRSLYHFCFTLAPQRRMERHQVRGTESE